MGQPCKKKKVHRRDRCRHLLFISVTGQTVTTKIWEQHRRSNPDDSLVLLAVERAMTELSQQLRHPSVPQYAEHLQSVITGPKATALFKRIQNLPPAVRPRQVSPGTILPLIAGFRPYDYYLQRAVQAMAAEAKA